MVDRSAASRRAAELADREVALCCPPHASEEWKRRTWNRAFLREFDRMVTPPTMLCSTVNDPAKW